MRPYLIISCITIFIYLVSFVYENNAQTPRTMSDEERKAEELANMRRGGFGECTCKKGTGSYCGWEIRGGCDCDSIYTCDKKDGPAKLSLICKSEDRKMGQSCTSWGKPLDKPATCVGASEKP